MASKTLNPFAKERTTSSSRPADPSAAPSTRIDSPSGFSRSFSRSSLLPKTKRAVLHPVKDVQQTDLVPTGLVLSLPPASTVEASPERSTAQAASSSTPSKESSHDKRWRLLWRGGLEVGKEGYRLDGQSRLMYAPKAFAYLARRFSGIAFCAKMSFPTATRPATTAAFDGDIPAVTVTSSTPLRPALLSRTSCGSDGRPISATPFSAASSADTDLCLSLESMKGKKWLKVKETVDLGSSEELEKVDMVEDGIQV